MSSKAAKSNNSRLIVQRDYSLVNNIKCIMYVKSTDVDSGWTL